MSLVVPDDIKTFQAKIEKELLALPLSKEPSELYEPIRYVLSLGGKRLRPTLLLMACNLFGGKIEDAIGPAIGIELFHNFTLVHDDIMDDASFRRNQPTVHSKWDKNRAILSGEDKSADNHSDK